VIQVELAGESLAVHGFCWIALGSEGRSDRTLASDQDNGIIFASAGGEDPEALRARLLPQAQRINQSLAKVGFSLCRGNIMAGNPQWCLSEHEWREKFAAWIATGDPAAILNATIFFDFRATFGNGALAERLRDWLAREVRGNERFLRQLAQNALTNRPPLGIVRDFTLSDDKAHPNSIDLKVNGATIFNDAARVYALANGITATNTVQRIQAAALCGAVTGTDAEAWVAAITFLQHFRLRHQYAQISRGEPADNHLQPGRLNALDRRLLKETLRTARNLQQRLALDYQLWNG
jgi:CBS domain-containing protein